MLCFLCGFCGSGIPSPQKLWFHIVFFFCCSNLWSYRPKNTLTDQTIEDVTVHNEDFNKKLWFSLWFLWFRYGFRCGFCGFVMVSLWFLWFRYGFVMVFVVPLWFRYGFVVSLWFHCGFCCFVMVSLWFLWFHQGQPDINPVSGLPRHLRCTTPRVPEARQKQVCKK